MTVSEATRIYLDRQERADHPAGSFDNAGRFYLAAEERCECCQSIRCPSRAWPYSEMLHGRTAEHVSHLTGISATEIRREARKARKSS